MRRATRSLPLLVAAIVVVACGGAATSAPAATPTASPIPTEVPATPTPTATAEPTATPAADGGAMVADAAGFTMPLAEGWRSLPLDGTAEDILALLPADSQLRGVLEGGLDQLLEAGLAGWAVDGTTEAGAVTPNVNLIVRRGIEIPGLDDLVGAIEGELAAVPGVNGIEVEVVDLAIGRAVRAAYLGLGEGAEARAQGIQYTIPAGDDLLILSFTLPANDAAREAAVEEMVTGIALAP
jgi:hypothetical protein